MIRIACGLLVFAVLGNFGVSFAADEVHWTITGPTSVTFDWRGSVSENSIAYGSSAGNYATTVTAANPTGTCVPWSSAGPFWEARLTGLAANTVYHYAVANGPDHTFRTAPPAGPVSFEIVAAGDVGDSAYYTAVAGIAQQMAQEPNARFALMVGDLTYADDHGQSHADQHFNDVMAWSQDAAYMPAWGNHEWDSEPEDDLRNYKGRFDFANPQTSVGTPAISDCGEDWYWFDYGNVRFIAYPEPWTGAWSDWNTKATSLMNAAQADPNVTWIVTFGHRPAFSTGHHAGSATLRGYLGALGLSHSKYVLNVNGHSHNYERSYPQNGVVHVTVGTGGSVLETDGPCLWLTCDQPPWSAVRYFHMGYLKLAFTPTSIQGSFICGPAGSGTNDITCTPGSVIDSFNLVPSVPSPTIYVDKANPQCSDSGTGTASQPFCTITAGVNAAVAGNTVLVKSGTYSEDVKLPRSGTSTAPFVVKAEPGANVVVSGQFRGFEISAKSWITIQGFTVSDTASFGIYVASGSSNITIADNHVTRAGQPVEGSTKAGIYVSGTTNSVVSGNTTDYNTDAGIAIVSGSTNAAVIGNVSSHNARGYTRAAPGIDVRSGGNVVKDNICHDNEDSGIQVFSSGGSPSPDNLLVDNLCYANGDHGIDVSSAGSQRIIGNTIYGNVTAGINIEGTSLLPSSGTVARNNLSVNNGVSSTSTKGNIRVDAVSVPGTRIDYDLVYLSASGTTISWNGVNYPTLAAFAAATGEEEHGLEAPPQFLDAANGDFHLGPGAPAIDSADSGADGASETDLEGQKRVDDPAVANTGTGPRDYDDRGAYEHPACGNGVREHGEDCDGTDTGSAVCATLGCGGGDPSCTAQCTLDYSTCTGCPICGNGVKEFGEDCDGGDLGGASCESIGQCSAHGGLACSSSCHFNLAGCSCGDGAIQCGEVCDGSNLGGQTCASRGFPAGGVLTCRSTCAAFDTSACSVCGDGVRQPTEACDGSNLGGATCLSQGCFAGTPTCTGTCTVNYASCSNCWAATLYVDKANPSCSDSGQGTAAAPFCTINGAAAKVVGGGTVIVASGTYPEWVKVLVTGTSAAPIVFKAATGATVNVVAVPNPPPNSTPRGFEISSKNWITIDGFNVTGTKDFGIYVKDCTHVTIRNNHVSYAGGGDPTLTKTGINVNNTFDSLISGNTTEDNSDSGIYVTSGGSSNNVTNVTVEGNRSARNARGHASPGACGIEIRSSGNTIRGNICHDNETSGILVKPFGGNTPVPNNLIVNNVTYANGGHGIGVNVADHSRIVGNTVYANVGSGIDLAGASTQSLVVNNIAVDNAPNVSIASGGNIRVENAAITGTTLDDDLVFRSAMGTMISWNNVAYTSLAAFVTATGKEAHGLQGNPQWVAPATADFGLKIGSPAIDSADSGASGASATDIDGTVRTDDRATTNTGAGPRTYDDRGAYEYPLDADHDGFASDEDCDDRNAALNPGVLDDSCNGIDEDCSGSADDDYVPQPTGTTCGIGACFSLGRTACVNGAVTNNPCTPGTPAESDATCDAIDDDCNGQSDEDYTETPTACGIGACHATGQSTCVNGELVDTCTPGTAAASDATCNGIDEDCNGEVDEDYAADVSCFLPGVCAAGNAPSSCTGGVETACATGSPSGISETVCNGADDDCDGSVDEDYVPTPTATTCGIGACAATGQNQCVDGVLTDVCTPGTPAASDATCNGIDDDCDGQSDEEYAPTPTACGIGACATTGQHICVNGTVTDTCVPGTPVPEVGCDGIDNDCNPQTPDVRDNDGDSVACPGDCDDSDPSTYPGAPEINDGKDNQCPGNVGYGSVDETSGDSGFHTPGDDARYSWPAQSGATSYDVARADSPDFNTGCQIHQTATPEWVDAAIPSSGKVFFYLNRARTPSTGSWGTRSSGAQRTVSCAGP